MTIMIMQRLLYDSPTAKLLWTLTHKYKLCLKRDVTFFFSNVIF